MNKQEYKALRRNVARYRYNFWKTHNGNWNMQNHWRNQLDAELAQLPRAPRFYDAATAAFESRRLNIARRLAEHVKEVQAKRRVNAIFDVLVARYGYPDTKNNRATMCIILGFYKSVEDYVNSPAHKRHVAA